MNSTRTISEYKSQAKDQLLGNYGVAIGSFVVIFAIFYGVFAVLMGAYGSWNIASMGASEGATLGSYIKGEIATTVMVFVSGTIFAVLNAGFLRLLMGISRGDKPKVSEVFYCFKNHPDKAIIIYLVLALIQFVATLPSTVLGYYVNFENGMNGKIFFYYILAIVAGYAVYIYFSVTFAMSYFVYLDDEEASAIDCLKISARIMKGQKLRYLYIILSLIGYFILGVLSLGIGMLYVTAYENMIIINMYKDLLGATNED